jgi:hypothetical protein
MSGTRYNVYEIQIQDDATDLTVAIAGGAFIVTVAGDTVKVALFNADTFASIANPVAPQRGKVRFATLATVEVVDIYGFAPTGHFVARRGISTGVTELFVDSKDALQVAVIPFAAVDYTANTETDTGLDFPLHSSVLPFPTVRVVTAEGSRTLEVGLLAAETAGDADGFVDAVSLATAGLVDPALSGTPTVGALLRQNFATTPAVEVPSAHPFTGANARSISMTSSASTASAKAMVMLPYLLSPL